MPITFKDYDIDRAGDGFDPQIPYQMVPIGGSRDFVVQTGDFQAELILKQTNITSLSNFRILRTTSPQAFLSGLPGPGFFVQRQIIPPRSVIQFALTGHTVGAAVLEGHDLPGGGSPPLKPDFNLLISVKAKETRQFALCHVFDRVNRDTGRRLDINRAFNAANAILENQSNFTIRNIDGSSTRQITLSTTTGKTFDFFNASHTRRVINQFDASFPGILSQVHAVIYIFKVPVSHTFRLKGKATPVRVLGFNQRAQNAAGRIFNMVYVGTFSARQAPLLDTTLAHEIGHSLGLDHLPERDDPNLPKLNVPGRPQMDLFMHNLMFPFASPRFARLNGLQVEKLHVKSQPASNITI
jgi:hypothetical protein